MRIAVDIQALQSVGSRDRGIGRYTFGLLQKLLEIDSENEYVLISNTDLQHANLEGLPPHRFRSIALSYPKDNRQASEIIMQTALLAAGIDIFHIASPFELDDAIIPQFSKFFPFKMVCTLYDLIPYLFSQHYLSDPIISEWYHRRLCNVIEADHIFAVSESTRQDAIKYLGVSSDKITNVSTGISPFFKPLPFGEYPQWRRYLQRKFNIHKKFVLYVGGDETRKNIAGLIKAYSELPDSLIAEYELVITCRITPSSNEHYLDIARKHKVDRRVVFTNFVSDDELIALYSLCSLFVFPSQYEGFGLPLAEAMACGAPVIGTNCCSLPEIVGDAGILVAAGSVEQLTEAMSRVLKEEQLRVEMSCRSLEQAKRFSWEDVAGKVLNVYRRLGPRHAFSFNFKRISSRSGEKPKIALFSPVNPVKSGISDYTEELLPYLAEHFQIDLYLDSNYQPSNDSILKHCLWYQHHSFEQRIEDESYMAVLYQLGNSSYHAYMVDYILKYGGIISLHDYQLGGLINWLSCELPSTSPNRLDLFEELKYGYGEARARYIFAKMQHGKLWPHEFINEGIFLNKRFVDRSIGLVVNSRWAYEMAKKDFPGYPDECLKHIPMGVPIFPRLTAKEIQMIRQRLGIVEDALVIGTFGIIAPPKRITSCIRAFARLAKENSKAVLLLVGECSPGYIEPMKLLQKLDLGGKARITGYVDFKLFYDYMRACDIVLNLRYPTMGGTSATLVRALSLGKPTIISSGGSFMELPDDVVLKVVCGADDEDDVTEKLMLLACDEELRYRMGENSYFYSLEKHSLSRISNEYVEFIFRCIQDRSVQIKLVADFTGKMLTHLGVSPQDDRVLNLASQAISRIL